MATNVIEQFRALLKTYLHERTTYDVEMKLFPRGMYATEGQWSGLLSFDHEGQGYLVILDGAYEVAAPPQGEPHVWWMTVAIATVYTPKGLRANVIAAHQYSTAAQRSRGGNLMDLAVSMTTLRNQAAQVIDGTMPPDKFTSYGWSPENQIATVKEVFGRGGQ